MKRYGNCMKCAWGVMAEAFSAQLEDAQFQAVSFEDRFAMLVDAEWSARKSNRLTRLIRNAGYADPCRMCREY